MHHLDMTAYCDEAYSNARAHGWHDEPRTDATVRALYHCELSEAMESYRKHEPLVWHACPYVEGACESQQVQDEDLHCEACRAEYRKPEGVAVELIDFVIRICDYLGSRQFVFPMSMDTAEKLAAWAVDDYINDEVQDVVNVELPELVDILHEQVTLSHVMKNPTYLTTAIGLVFAWICHNGIDPVDLVNEKHAYNKTRSYKHGNKKC